MRNHDLVFLKQFSMIIAFLVALTIVLILAGMYINAQQEPEPNPVAEAAVQQRLSPIGGVYAGATGAAAAAAAQATAAAAAAGQVAYEGTLDGSVIYAALCGACHTAGAGRAPQIGRAARTPRHAPGADVHAKNDQAGYQGAAGDKHA
ncbi:MAG: cytochrome c5 family protein, partial [Arenimonas sp.]|uniref:cytochrome c5 family protein n=1 Tax=Arenimonas sp. TaxID=1872635 RepID=UPI0025C1F37A